MYEPADPLLLDRNASQEQARAVLGEPLAFLADLVNYGTHLIIKALGDGEGDTSRLVVCAGLLKHIVGMLDAAVVLLENGHSTMALTQVRSAFEATLYLELILQEDTEYRARVYLVGEYRRRLAFLQRALDPSTAPGSFNHDYAHIGMSTHTLSEEAKTTGVEHVAHIQSVLAQPGLARIDATYQKKRGNKAFDPYWYELLGHKTIRQLAKALKEGPSYDLWYGGGSQVVHAQSPTQHWSVQGDVAALKAIRHLEDAHSVKNGVAQVALHAYRLVVRKYLPDDFPALQQKYLADWRKPFRSSVKIQYEYQGQ